MDFDMNKSLETIKNYEKYFLYRGWWGLISCLSSIFAALLIYFNIINIYFKFPPSVSWLIPIFFVAIFFVSCVLYKLNKTYYSVNGLYAKTILKSFLHYSNTGFISKNQCMRKLWWFFNLYNQSSNPKINNIILDLDNKIKLLIDEDNKINGFGYVVTKACYDVIIEEIKKAEQEINEIKKLKSLEMTNHFRRIIN